MTPHLHAFHASLAAALLFLLATVASAQSPPEGAAGRVLERAVALLPARPEVPIRLIDPELTPDPAGVNRVDAFVVREPDGRIRQTIYVNSRSGMFQNALGGKKMDVAILAGVIQHELEHLRGGGEKEARLAERKLFQHLIFVGEVPADSGFAYLALLEQNNRMHEAR